MDNDCNDIIDDALDVLIWFLDNDGDGYGDENTTITACSAPEGYVADSSDCDDTDSSLGSNENGCEPVVVDDTVYTLADVTTVYQYRDMNTLISVEN